MYKRQPDQDELARRIRAAMAYARIDRDEMADALGTSPATLDRKLRKRSEVSELTWEDAWTAAAVTGLPLAFFVADYGHLREHVPKDVPIPASSIVEEEARLAAQRRRDRRRASGGTRGARGGSRG